MNAFFLLPLASTALLLACGQNNAAPLTSDTGPDMQDLRHRVAHVTGKTYAEPPEANAAALGTPPASGATDAQRPVPEQGGLHTISIPSKDFNMTMAQLDLPARWKVQTYPNGVWKVDEAALKVWDVSGGNYAFGNGQMAQLYQQNGGAVRAPMAPEQVVLQDAVPRMRKLGYELIGQSDVPAVAQAEQQGLDGLYSTGQQRKTSRVNLSEWHQGDQRVALVMHWSSFESPGLGNWSYYFTRLEAPASRFDQEKNALLAGLASLRYNPAYFAAYAQSEQTKAAQSWAVHNDRMNSNQAAFNAQQQAHRNRTDAVNDAIMGTWRSTNASMDRQQNATINGIRGEQDAYNPYTGEAGKIETGYDQYWMNSDGQYIGTNDVMYDPNINSDHVDQWRKVPTKP